MRLRRRLDSTLRVFRAHILSAVAAKKGMSATPQALTHVVHRRQCRR
jgi:hypothetical protein